MSCRSIIGKKVIDFFDGKIFNIHPAYLPKERGGGIFSWRILNNIKEISATIHYLDEGIDTGNIVLQEKGILEKNVFKNQDEINAHVNAIEKAKLDLSDDVRTIELKNWLNYLKN